MALGLLLLPVAGMAQTLVLTQRNGTVNRFALSDEPVITYSGSDVVVKWAALWTCRNLSGLKKIQKYLRTIPLCCVMYILDITGGMSPPRCSLLCSLLLPPLRGHPATPRKSCTESA